MLDMLSTRHAWSKNGVQMARALTAKEMMRMHPPGAYTTARTIDNGVSRSLEYRAHTASAVLGIPFS